MKYRISKLLGIQEPADGYSETEQELAKELSNLTYKDIYSKLPTSRMKAIVALHLELGLPQETVADIFEIEQPRVVEEIENIKKILLSKPFKPHKVKNKVEIGQLVQLCKILKNTKKIITFNQLDEVCNILARE